MSVFGQDEGGVLVLVLDHGGRREGGGKEREHRALRVAGGCPLMVGVGVERHMRVLRNEGGRLAIAEADGHDLGDVVEVLLGGVVRVAPCLSFWRASAEMLAWADVDTSALGACTMNSKERRLAGQGGLYGAEEACDHGRRAQCAS